MKKIVSFDENGSEYTGTLEIECDTFEKIGERSINVNGAVIIIDEDIQSIEDVLCEENVGGKN